MLKILPVDESSSRPLEELNRIYAGVDFKIFQSSDADHFITCFFAIFKSISDCLDLWERINSTVAVVSQELMHSDSGPWNLYLIMLTPENLSKEIKYKIENDRFAARKITFSLADLPLDSADPYNSIIDDLILGADLRLFEPRSDCESLQATHKSEIRNFLLANKDGIPHTRSAASREVRKKFITQLLMLTAKS